MRVVQGAPPAFDKIDAKFGVKGKSALFAWGDTIYSIGGCVATTPLLVHERIHADRQEALGGPVAWWDRYIEDDDFRLREEIAAHIGEFETRVRLAGDSSGSRRKFALDTAIRLCNPIYKWPRTPGFITVKRAKALIQRFEHIDDVDFAALQTADAERAALGSMVQ